MASVICRIMVTSAIAGVMVVAATAIAEHNKHGRTHGGGENGWPLSPIASLST